MNTEKDNNQGLYNPCDERDACGVGFVARLDASPSHRIIEDALAALNRLAHRGGTAGGHENADGAGLLLPLPTNFMRRIWRPICGALPERHALAQFFFPHNAGMERSWRELAEEIAQKHGLAVLGWREVPVRPEALGEAARQTMPLIRQMLAAPEKNSDKISEEDFERRIYIARRHLEKHVSENFPELRADFHIASFSSRSVVYKGMLPGGKLAAFYQDLADREFAAHFAIFHERFSTNTKPAWRLAQPMRCLAHNGEINTLSCNQANMAIREPLLSSDLFGEDLKYLLPVLDGMGSDSAMLDNAMELLARGGRSLAHAAMMLLPEPFGSSFIMGEDKRAFYEYHAALMEPWDGPAALVFTDGCRQVGAMQDRNALRSCRYLLTDDGLFLLASEAGVLDLPESRVVRRGRLEPRRMLMVDFARRRIITDAECKGRVIYAKPYRHWIREHAISLKDLPLPGGNTQNEPAPHEKEDNLRRCQALHGYSKEDLEDILKPMAQNAQEPIASMGDDTPLAVLSRRPQQLFSYLKQRFAQVTNPPMDPLREGLVMTLMGFAGRRRNLLEESPEHYSLLRLANPILWQSDLARLEASTHPSVKTVKIPILFAPIAHDEDKMTLAAALEQGLENMFAASDAALEAGASILLLSDAKAGPDAAPIPSLLAVSALHQRLIRQKKRHACGIMVDCGDAREVMHIAQLVAFGASAVYPRLAFASVESLAGQEPPGSKITKDKALRSYVTALQKGLLKTFSRMGISSLRSFMGGQALFEAIGLGEELVSRHFTGLPSRIGGIGLEDIAQSVMIRHEKAFNQPKHCSPTNCDSKPRHYPELEESGKYHNRKNGERHLWSSTAVRALHKAVRENDLESYRIYAEESDEQAEQPVTLRGLLRFAARSPIPLCKVEPAENIMRRFVGAAMSYGSISPEAHQTLAAAFNHCGGRSNCGEGGEDPQRDAPVPGGPDYRSRIRQIASGRFGVTAGYLASADEIQIKMAQGAKPGEGGQLPGRKVNADIARVRHTIPGVTLISPPPHHDIYSIEDLAQLIFDLKSLNPTAKISVKLVSGLGIGTIASGVAKAGADIILISGHDGGTGASPRTAVNHVGLPWEMGLAETRQALTANGLRQNVRLQVDGQIRTGRDLVMAALLGAEEFGLGTGALVALGCRMLRICHLGTCPAGIATQDPKRRSRFSGQPEHLERYLHFLAEDMRGHMAALGFKTVEEMIGHTEVLEAAPQLSGGKAATLNLAPILARQNQPEEKTSPQNNRAQTGGRQTSEPSRALNAEMLESTLPAIKEGRPIRFAAAVRNTDRAVCASLSGEIARLYGETGLPPGSVEIALHGAAGQSAGAFLMRGIRLHIKGEVNDYAGKGLSGGILAVAPPYNQAHTIPGQTIAGNVALYGATSGEAYFAGTAGERFAVRNSGASAVVEGVGDHGCEYMTGGTVVVLGGTGCNFAAGMSGGMAYVYDRDELLQTRCNMDGVDLESVWRPEDITALRSLLDRHARHTGSPVAKAILEDWQASLPLFIKVTPIEYQHALDRLKNSESPQTESVAATEEVYK